jgi:membrane protein
VERFTRSVLDVGRRALVRFVELEGFDRAMALAGQAFAALLPLLIVVGAVTPGGGKDLADGLIDRFDLTGQAASTLHAAVAQPAAVQDGVSALSAFLLVVSALSFTRAMQRLYVRAWRLPPMRMAGNAWGLAWLVAFSVFWMLQPVVISVFDGPAEPLVSAGLSIALWLFTPWLLVGRRIPWRRLLPQATLTWFGLALLTVGCLIYLPRSIASAANQFGFIGVAFALLSLLFMVAMVLVVSAALGASIVEAPGADGQEVEEPREHDPAPVRT